MIVTVNNDDSDYVMTLPAQNASVYIGALSGERVSVNGGSLVVNVKANSGDIWIPAQADGAGQDGKAEPVILDIKDAAGTPAKQEPDKNERAQADAAKDSQPAKAAQQTGDSQPAKAAGHTKSGIQPSKAADRPKDSNSVKTADQKERNQDPAEKEAFEKGRIAGLQEAILAIMEKNGPVTDQMRRDVENNVYHDSLVTWIKSFR